jgi:predicted phosphodiesterase
MNTQVGLLGDTHGSKRWTHFALWCYKQAGIKTVYQVGDFGVGPERADTFASFVNKWAKTFDLNLVIVPGNHEDYDHIDNLRFREDGFQHYRSNLKIAPRGHRWEHDGVKFVALGGAPSVDRAFRLTTKQKSWWMQEMITKDDALKTVAGGLADVFLAHDAPFTPTIDMHIAGNPMGFRLEDLHYALEGRELMHKVVSEVKPVVFAHGHYHIPVNDVIEWDDGSKTRVFGLDCDGKAASIGFLDLSNLRTTHTPPSTAKEWQKEYLKVRF